MKSLWFFLPLFLGMLFLALVGCADRHNGPVTFTYVGCSVSKKGTVSTITCPDGTVSYVVDGVDGNTGLPGQNGHSAASKVTPADTSLCTNGGSVVTLGLDTNDDSNLSTDEVTNTAVICNGVNGSDAPATPFTPVAVVSACGGDIHDSNNEVFIKMSNGLLIGSVSDNSSGLNTRFGVVSAGTWYSTGHNTCVFTVNADGSISN